MIINKITREYSKSINTKTYGAPESWVKISSVIEAQLESTDDPKMVSDHLQELVRTDVLAEAKAVIDKVRAGVAAGQNNSNSAPGGTAANNSVGEQPRTL